MMKTSVFLPFTIAALAAATGVGGDSWTSFQNGGELTRTASGLPTEWSLESGIAWRAPIEGTGQSSPVIQDGRVYVTSVSGANKETYHMSAYSLADGSKLWQRDFTNPSPQECSGYVSLAAPTPAADERGVVCFFEGGHLVALTPAGEPRSVWRGLHRFGDRAAVG
jgi:outer membrane protein assembly factor BamB